MYWKILSAISIITIFVFGSNITFGYNELDKGQLNDIKTKLQNRATDKDLADLNWFVLNLNDSVFYEPKDPKEKFNNVDQYINKLEKAEITPEDLQELVNRLEATLHKMPMIDQLGLMNHFNKEQLKASTLEDYRALLKKVIEDIRHIQEAVHQIKTPKPVTKSSPPLQKPNA